MNVLSSVELSEYTLGKYIGSGEFGDVHVVIEKKSGKEYAAKISKNLINGTKNQLLDISREVNILSKINHPSILHFIGFSPINFQNEQKPIIIYEYLPYGTLADAIEL